MGYSNFKAHIPETQAIIEKHKNDFNNKTVSEYLKKAGGYKAYVKSLGGVFAKYINFTGKIKTYKELEEIADYVWGLYDIWGVDYGNGCSYTYSNNVYKTKSDSSSRFYLTENPKARFNVNYAAFGFANGSDMPGVDEMLGNPDKYYAVLNCDQGVLQLLKKAGLVSKDLPGPGTYPALYKSKGYSYKIITNANQLMPGDVILCFNKTTNKNLTTLSNWMPNHYHTTIVIARDNINGTITCGESGHKYTYYGEYRNITKIKDNKPYSGAKDWLGVRYNWGLKMDLTQYTDLELALMVWEGCFGSGDARKAALGDRFDVVQKLVELGQDELKKRVEAEEANQKTSLRLAIELLEGNFSNENQLGDKYNEVKKILNEEMVRLSDEIVVDLVAQEVLTGYWGSGDTRKTKLVEAGYDYNKVQDRVNEIVESKKDGWIEGKYYIKGKAVTGLQLLEKDGKTDWYYFDEDGDAQSGELTITANFNADGKLIG